MKKLRFLWTPPPQVTQLAAEGELAAGRRSSGVGGERAGRGSWGSYLVQTGRDEGQEHKPLPSCPRSADRVAYFVGLHLGLCLLEQERGRGTLEEKDSGFLGVPQSDLAAP